MLHPFFVLATILAPTSKWEPPEDDPQSDRNERQKMTLPFTGFTFKPWTQLYMSAGCGRPSVLGKFVSPPCAHARGPTLLGSPRRCGGTWKHGTRGV